MIPLGVLGAAHRIGGGGGALFDAIMADSPYWYLRLNDTSGAVAEGSAAGRDGVYRGSVVELGRPALYVEGPTSVLVNGARASIDVPTGNMPSAYNVASFVCVYRRVGTSGGLRQIATHGNGGTGLQQAWQFRLNGSALEFVKVSGGAATYPTGSTIAAGAAVILGFDIAVDGAVRRLTVYMNGASVYTTTFSVTAFSTSDVGLGVGGFNAGLYDSETNHEFSEVAFFDHAIGAGRHSAYAIAGGFA